MRNRVVVLLTAAIDVKGVGHTVVDDVNERYSEYQNSLIKWVSSPSVKEIVFCDNSGVDLSSWEGISSATGKAVEIHSYEGQDFSRELGKGFGEMSAMEYAWKNSLLFQSADLIIKVNGRYNVKNISSIIKQLESGHSSVYGTFRHNLTWFDSRVFAFTPQFFSDYMLPYKGKLNDSKGFYFEHALAMAVHRAMSDGYAWEMLNDTPAIEGKSGSNGRVYSVYGVRWIAKMIYQSLVRMLLRL